MAAEVIKGLDGFTLTGQQEDWKSETGYAVVKSYQGPQASRESFRTSLILAGASSVTMSTGVPCVVSAVFPLSVSGWNEDQQAQDEAVWELIGEVVEKRLESHGKFNLLAGSQGVLALIEKDISDGSIANPTTGALAKDWDTLYAGVGSLNQYAKLRMFGTDSYQETVWRVRMSMTVSRVSRIKCKNTDVGKIVAWSAIGVPAAAKFNQPTIHICKPLGGGTFTDELVGEWLVQPPQVRWRKLMRKWDVTQEWIGTVSASATIYDGGTLTL
jgi:hypothetical protein